VGDLFDEWPKYRRAFRLVNAGEMGANPDQLIHGDARGADHPAPRVINTDKQAGYPRISLPAAFSF
jgi:hypothetical protein